MRERLSRSEGGPKIKASNLDSSRQEEPPLSEDDAEESEVSFIYKNFKNILIPKTSGDKQPERRWIQVGSRKLESIGPTGRPVETQQLLTKGI